MWTRGFVSGFLILGLLFLAISCGKDSKSTKGSDNSATLATSAVVAEIAAMPLVDIGYPSMVFDFLEPAAISDRASVYEVEKDAALNASIITYDSASTTFADVNNDIYGDDAVVAEIEAHLVIDTYYPDDGKDKNATFRMRGQSTRLAEQKSYRVQLSKDDLAWNGEKVLQLNKHPYDMTRVRNKLAFDLFRDIPHIPSLRTQFIHLSITNKDQSAVQYDTKDYGLFTHIEKMGEDYLSRRGLPRDGNIYKAEDFDFSLNTNLALAGNGDVANKTNFEKVLELEATNHQHTRLIAMLTALNDPNTDFEVLFAKHFNKSNYLTWVPTALLFGNRDTRNRNFALYHAANSDTFYFLPWDYDTAFGYAQQLDHATSPHAHWQQTLANWWGIALHQKFMTKPVHLNELKLAVDEIYARYLKEFQLKAKLDKYKPLIQDCLNNPPDSNTQALMAEWETEYNRISASVQKNRQLFIDGLEEPMPFWMSAELLTNNQLRLAWDSSYDLQGDALSYQVQVATTPDFALPLVNETLSNTTELLTAKPANGIYYLKITAKDSNNHSGEAFDRVTLNGQTWFGVYSFELSDTKATQIP